MIRKLISQMKINDGSMCFKVVFNHKTTKPLGGKSYFKTVLIILHNFEIYYSIFH